MGNHHPFDLGYSERLTISKH